MGKLNEKVDTLIYILNSILINKKDEYFKYQYKALFLLKYF